MTNPLIVSVTDRKSIHFGRIGKVIEISDYDELFKYTVFFCDTEEKISFFEDQVKLKVDKKVKQK